MKILNQVKDNLSEMIKDSDSKISSKRAIGIIAFILVITTWVANLFFDYIIQPDIFDGLIYIVAIALTTSVAEKFTKANMIRAKKHLVSFKGDDTNQAYETDIQINATAKTKPTRKIID